MSDKFEFIDVEYAAYQESDEQYVPSIVKMCIWMAVSRSGSTAGGISRNRRRRKGAGYLRCTCRSHSRIPMTRTGSPGPRGPGGVGRAGRRSRCGR